MDAPNNGPQQSTGADQPPRYRRHTLWMGEIDQSGYMDESVICQLLGPDWLPHISNVKLIRNKFTGFPIGYGFIEFFNEDTAEQCLNALNGQPMPGMHPPRYFRLNYAQTSSNSNAASTPAASSNSGTTTDSATTNETDAGDGSSSSNSGGQSNAGGGGPRGEFSVFVGDLDYLVTDEQMKEIFGERYNSVTSARVIRDERNQSRGYGFVRFTDRFEQERSIREMNGLLLGQKHIRVSTATPKSSSAGFAAQRTQYGGGGGGGGGRSDPPFMNRSYNTPYNSQQQQQQVWDSMTPEQTSAFYAAFYQYYNQLQQTMATGNYEEFYANFQAQALQDTTGAAAYLMPTVQAQMPPNILASAHHQPAAFAGIPAGFTGPASQYQNGVATQSTIHAHSAVGGMHLPLAEALRHGAGPAPQWPTTIPAGGFNPLAKNDTSTIALYQHQLRQALFTINYNEFMQRIYNFQQLNTYKAASRLNQMGNGISRVNMQYGFNPVGNGGRRGPSEV